jgi:hypothetical protein
VPNSVVESGIIYRVCRNRIHHISCHPGIVYSTLYLYASIDDTISSEIKWMDGGWKAGWDADACINACT